MSKKTSIARLNELFLCDPQTGSLTWKVSRGRMRAGSTAGSRHKHLGYVVVSVDGHMFLAHRIVWAMVNECWPKHFIDHINGIRSDNRISNLRDVSPQVNGQNRSKAASHNKCGFLGVRQVYGDKFSASIRGKDGRAVHLGTFDTKEQASTAYMAAKASMHEGVGAQNNQFLAGQAQLTVLEELQALRAA